MAETVPEQSLAPTTTTQQDLTVAGQRKINLIWEYTQAAIAIAITLAIIFCAVKKVESQELRNAWFLIIGFYFSRTNHAQIGGIGDKPVQEYKGR